MRWDKAVCIASGPSLTVEDCELVMNSGLHTVVTNLTFRLCPWADVLIAHDGKWWRRFGAEVDTVFSGRKISVSPVVRGVESAYKDGLPWFHVYRNSGACAIAVAQALGAKKIILLGYDCGYTDRKHWHEDYRGMDNAGSISGWPKLFAIVAKRAKEAGVTIINASRQTNLTCFERAELETVL